MEDQITTDRLNESGDPATETQNADQLQSVRAELITLAEKGEEYYTVRSLLLLNLRSNIF